MVAFSFGILFFISTGFLFGKKREKMLISNHLSVCLECAGFCDTFYILKVFPDKSKSCLTSGFFLVQFIIENNGRVCFLFRGEWSCFGKRYKWRSSMPVPKGESAREESGGLKQDSIKNMVDRGYIRAELSYITRLEFHGLLLQNLSMRYR